MTLNTFLKFYGCISTGEIDINISHILKVVLSLFKVLHMVQGITDYYI